MRRRRVSREERDLWHRAVRDVTPFRHAVIDVAADELLPIPMRRGREPTAENQTPKGPGPRATASHFVLGGGDPRLDRAAATRRIAIERILDLHGLTQVEAHRLLLRFIASSAADGLRLVLVITGKGRPAADQSARTGILKSRFLDWVEAPPLKGEIARVAPAKPKDGGAGAFYVFLKRKSAGQVPRF